MILKEQIEQFLNEERIAVVGISREEDKFSNQVYQKLSESGYKLHPVHPSLGTIDGDQCVTSICDLPNNVQALMVIASANVAVEVLRQVPETNIKRVWVFCGVENKPIVENEIRLLRNFGISVISGFCPFMFVEPVTLIHAVHRFFVRLIGKYPK